MANRTVEKIISNCTTILHDKLVASLIPAHTSMRRWTCLSTPRRQSWWNPTAKTSESIWVAWLRIRSWTRPRSIGKCAAKSPFSKSWSNSIRASWIWIRARFPGRVLWGGAAFIKNPVRLWIPLGPGTPKGPHRRRCSKAKSRGYGREGGGRRFGGSAEDRLGARDEA